MDHIRARYMEVELMMEVEVEVEVEVYIPNMDKLKLRL